MNFSCPSDVGRRASGLERRNQRTTARLDANALPNDRFGLAALVVPRLFPHPAPIVGTVETIGIGQRVGTNT